jgi:hypothetical protein
MTREECVAEVSVLARSGSFSLEKVGTFVDEYLVCSRPSHMAEERDYLSREVREKLQDLSAELVDQITAVILKTEDPQNAPSVRS